MSRVLAPARFESSLLEDLDPPVRRFFAHAIRRGAALPEAVDLEMAGRIRLGRAWVAFRAQQQTSRDGFRWEAHLGPRRLTLLRVADWYGAGAGATEGRLFGRARIFRSGSPDTVRSAAGRAALEAVTFAPAAVLPQRGVTWRAEGARVAMGTWELPPERPQVRVRLEASGAVRSVVALRWQQRGRAEGDYVACGCDVHAERRFGDFLVPSRFTVSWGWGTPDASPFFQAEVMRYEPRTRAPAGS